MRSLLTSPMDSLFWGWRRAAWGYVGIAGLSLTMVVPTFCPMHWSFDNGPTLWNLGAVEAWRGNAHFISGDQAPSIDPATGIASLPGYFRVDEWNAGVLAVLRREGSVTPTFKDRIVDPIEIAAAFDRDRGTDMGDGSKEIRVGDLRVSIAPYDWVGCQFGRADSLQRGDVSFSGGHHILRVIHPGGRRQCSLDSGRSRGVAWIPQMATVRARTSDDGRTLWLRGVDTESKRWIITADLVTATVIQIDADPAR